MYRDTLNLKPRDMYRKMPKTCFYHNCKNPRGGYALCTDHRMYMRIAKARGVMARELGIPRSAVSTDLAILRAILQKGSVYSHGNHGGNKREREARKEG